MDPQHYIYTHTQKRILNIHKGRQNSIMNFHYIAPVTLNIWPFLVQQHTSLLFLLHCFYYLKKIYFRMVLDLLKVVQDNKEFSILHAHFSLLVASYYTTFITTKESTLAHTIS